MIFDNLANLGDMLKKAKELQGKIKQVTEELQAENYESQVEGVKCVVSGDMEVKEIKIDPAMITSGKMEKLESSVFEAVNSAMHEAKGVAKDKIRRLTGGLSIPGLL